MMEQEIILIATFTAKTDKEENIKRALLSLVESTRKEKGCILYNFHIDKENSNTFIFYEIWSDKESLDLHANGTHFKNVMSTIENDLERPLEITFLDKQ